MNVHLYLDRQSTSQLDWSTNRPLELSMHNLTRYSNATVEREAAR